MIDRSAIGRRFGPYSCTVDANRLRFFARVIGETRPEYIDSDAARAAGWRDIPAPPTYAFCLPMLDPADGYDWAASLGIDIRRALHGEQSFTYSRDLCAGDLIIFETEIIDVYDRKDGALTFVVDHTWGRSDDGDPVVEARRTLIVRNR